MGASVGAIAGVPLLLLALARGSAWDAGLATAGAGRGRGAAAADRLGAALPRAGRARPAARWRCALFGRCGAAAPSTCAGRHARQPARPAVERGRGLRARPHRADRLHHPSLGVGRAGRWAPPAPALLISATGVTAFGGRLVLARIVDRVDPRRLAVVIMLLQTAALAAIALWPFARRADRRQPRLRLRHRPRDDAGPGRRAPRVRRRWPSAPPTAAPPPSSSSCRRWGRRCSACCATASAATASVLGAASLCTAIGALTLLLGRRASQA